MPSHSCPTHSAVVFDNAIWEGAGRAGLIPPNPHAPAVGGTLVSGADLEALARSLAMDPSHLTGRSAPITRRSQPASQ